MNEAAEIVDRVRTLLNNHGLALTGLLTVLVFLGLFVYADGPALVRALRKVSVDTILLVLGLTTIGYVFRFAKWHLYLQWLNSDVPVGTSLLTFICGLMMVVTPGKAGELWKAWFLSDLENVPVNRTASVVGAERVTDIIALSGMALSGVLIFQRSSAVLVGVAAVLISGILLLQWRWFCLRVLDTIADFPIVGGFASQFEEFYENTYSLFRPKPLLITTFLSLIAWGLEGVALWYILDSFGPSVGLTVGIFVFGLGSIVGAVSLLPGGLGAAEASMVALLLTFNYPEATAAAATIVIRVGTLWYAAALGATVFTVYKSWCRLS